MASVRGPGVAPDLGEEIAAAAEGGDDADDAALFNPRLAVGDDVGVAEGGEQLHLTEGGLALAVRLPGEADLLEHVAALGLLEGTPRAGEQRRVW